MPTMTSVAVAVLAIASGLSGSGGAPAVPLRFVSASNYGPQSFQSVGVNVATTVDQYSRIPIIIGADTTSLQVGFFNWWLAPASGVTNPTNSFTVTQCAIEIGATTIQIFFSGSASVIMTPGQNLVSDSVTSAQFSLAKFAQGTTGFIRSRVTLANPATDKLAYCGASKSTSAGIQPRVDVTKVNVTNGVLGTGVFAYSMINGGVNGTDAISGNPYSPLLLGTHSQPSVGFWGDSKTYGTGDTVNTIGVIGMNRTLCPTAGVAAGARSGCNFGNPSGIAADCTTTVGGASLASLTYWYQYCSYAVVGYGTNALTQAAQTALINQIRTAGIVPIVQRSLTPRTTPLNTDPISITSLTTDTVTTLVTGTMADTSGLINGQSYPISGASLAVYNGTFAITVVTGTVFTYTAGSVPAANPTGTIVMDDQWRTTKYQAASPGWSIGGSADIFETFLRGLIASDANLTYYQSQGERAGTTGTAYWQWGVNGTVKFMTPDGLHESAVGYEQNIGTSGTATTQAGGTVATSLRALVQAFV